MNAKSEQKELCKNNPLECGIVISSDLLYSENDLTNKLQLEKENCKSNPSNCDININDFSMELNKEKDLSYEEGKTYCIENPSMCGISIVQDGSSIDTVINNSEIGWSLLGTEKEIENITTKYNLKTSWIFRNSTWIKDPEIVNEFEGVWIRKY